MHKTATTLQLSKIKGSLQQLFQSCVRMLENHSNYTNINILLIMF